MKVYQNHLVTETAVKSTHYSVNNEASFYDNTHKQRLYNRLTISSAKIEAYFLSPSL